MKTLMALLGCLTFVAIDCGGTSDSEDDNQTYTFTSIQPNPDGTITTSTMQLTANQTLQLLPSSASKSTSKPSRIQPGVELVQSAAQWDPHCYNGDLWIFDVAAPSFQPHNTLCISPTYETGSVNLTNLCDHLNVDCSDYWAWTAKTFWPGYTNGGFYATADYTMSLQEFRCNTYQQLTTLTHSYNPFVQLYGNGLTCD
jgi:hypothetical protein